MYADDIIATSKVFEISPVKPDPESDGSIVMCTPLEATKWGVYGRQSDGTAAWIADFPSFAEAMEYIGNRAGGRAVLTTSTEGSSTLVAAGDFCDDDSAKVNAQMLGRLRELKNYPGEEPENQ